jgi:hypothetical protein
MLQKKGGDAAPADLEAASLEELHQKILTLEKEKNKEEEHRNYMQLERVRTEPVRPRCKGEWKPAASDPPWCCRTK